MKNLLKHLLCACCMMLFPLLTSCDRRSKEEQLPSPLRVEQDAPKHVSDVATASDSKPKVKVNLVCDGLDLDDLARGLASISEKRVNVDPAFQDLRPKYRYTHPDELVAYDEAVAKMIAKLRSDGLEVLESKDSIEIKPGSYQEVWKPGR